MEMPGIWNVCCRKLAAQAQKRGHVGCNQQDHRGTAGVPQKLDMELWDLVLVLLFALAWVPFLFSMPLYLPFGIEMFTLCH
jgi:hypothetical protein